MSWYEWKAGISSIGQNDSKIQFVFCLRDLVFSHRGRPVEVPKALSKPSPASTLHRWSLRIGPNEPLSTFFVFHSVGAERKFGAMVIPHLGVHLTRTWLESQV